MKGNKIKIIFFIFFSLFILISCKEEDSTLCGDTTCEYWQECNDEKCELKENFCISRNDCSNNLPICGKDHRCKVAKVCTPTCNTWEYCDENSCKLQVNKCNNLDDCEDNFNKCDNHECIIANLCESKICQENATCEIINNQPKCTCNNGYKESGDNCIISDLCNDIVCQENATCNSNNGECTCNEGFHKDGDSCIVTLENSKIFYPNGLILNENQKVDLIDSVLIMQLDGNLVLYKKNPTKALWATSTNCGNNCNYKFIFQADGDLVVFDNNETLLWSAGTNTLNVHHLIIDNKKLGLYNDLNHLIWSSTCENGDLVNADCILYNPCDDTTCPLHSTCNLNNGNAECKCDTGYEESGETCIEIDNCNGVTCQTHATCNTDNGNCYCDNNYHISSNVETCIDNNICGSLNCTNHSTCDYDTGSCKCNEGYHDEGGTCIENEQNACGGCSGHGTCYIQEGDPVCACDIGYTPGDPNRTGLDCVLTNTVCKAGEINYDLDEDGVNETWFTPTADECEMFEILNFIRAVHDKEGSDESHKPLRYDIVWSAHARNHSQKMIDQGGLFHDDHPGGQNCAYGRGPLGEMGMYMGCSNPKEEFVCKSAREGHCAPLSHHCNIMRPRFSYVGIGTVGTWNTQNFH